MINREPRLTEPLKPTYIIREGQPVKISCRFDAHPRGDIQWLKDGIPIDFASIGISRDFTVVREVDYSALIIKEGFPEDTGSYTVVIRNPLGEARSYTKLAVEDYFSRTPDSDFSDTPSKPTFVQPLRDITVTEGQKLKLHAAINAQPEPEIIWYHNDVPIKDSRDVTLKFDGQLCTLYKDRCSLSDIGSYRLSAVNSSGLAESVCHVTITSAQGAFRENRLLSSRLPPVFIELLKEQTLAEGEKAIMSVKLSGQPKPQVSWYKDDQLLRNTNEHKIINQDDIYKLEIPELFSDNAGIYSVKAVNSEGEAQSFASLNVLSKSFHQKTTFVTTERSTNTSVQQKDGVSNEQGLPPEFLQLFTDTEIKLNSSITFEATVVGIPKPNIIWLFNELPIPKSRYQQTVTNDTYTLTIRNVRENDAGRYSLVAENSLGKATCTAELFIRNENQQDNSRKCHTTDQDFHSKQHLKEHKVYSDDTRQGRIYDDLWGDREHSQTATRAVKDYNETVHRSFDRSYSSHEYVVRSIKEQQHQQRTRSLSRDNSQRSSRARTKECLRKCASIESVLSHILDKAHKYKTKKHYYDTNKRQYGKRQSNTVYDYSTATSDQHNYSDTEQYFRIPHVLTKKCEQSMEENVMDSDDTSTKTKRAYATINRGNNRKRTVEEEKEYESVEEIYHQLKRVSRIDDAHQRSASHRTSSKPIVATTETDRMRISNENYHKDYQHQSQNNIAVQPTVIRQELSMNQDYYNDQQQRVLQQNNWYPDEILDHRLVPTSHEYLSRSTTQSEGGFTTTSENYEQRERQRLHQTRTKDRSIPIRIASTSSIPDEIDVKYQAFDNSSSMYCENTFMSEKHERHYVSQSVENLLLPKQHIEQAEHHSTSQQSTYGEHETKIIEEVIETLVDELQLLIDKTDRSTTIMKEKHSKPQIYSPRPTRPLLGEYELRIIDQSIGARNELQVVFPKQQPETEYQSTLQVQAKNLTVDNQYGKMADEHLFTVLDSKLEVATTENKVEFVIPKPIRDNIAHIEEHSTTVFKSIGDVDRHFVRSRKISSSSDQSSDYGEGHSNQNVDVNKSIYIYETEDTGYASGGEHSTTYVQHVPAKFEPIDLVIDKPKIQPSISKIIADIQGQAQITSIRPTKIIQQEDSSVELMMDLSKQPEQYDEMEVILEKPKIRDSSSKVLANIQPGLELKSIRSTGALDQLQGTESSSSLTMQMKEDEDETMELRIAKPRVQDSSSILIADIQGELGVQGKLIASSLQQEDSSTAIVMDLSTQKQEHAPFELIIPKFGVEKSTSTVVAQVAPTLAGIKTTISVPPSESSSSLFLEQRLVPDELVDIILPKPKIGSSSTTVIADVSAKLETKSIRATDFKPETSTSTFFLDKTVHEIPEPVEIRLKQPKIQDSSTTVVANVKAALDTRHVQMLGKYEKQQDSSSTVVLDSLKNKGEHEQVELILPRPRVQESTSIVLANVKPTLDTQLIIAPQPFVEKSTSQLILDGMAASEPESVELVLKRQSSSHTLVAKLDDARRKTKEMYVLGTAPALQQSGYVRESSSTLHTDLNKPIQLILDIDENEGNRSGHMFYDQRRQLGTSREYSSRMLADSGSSGGLVKDSSSTYITEIEPKYYEPIEFVVSGGVVSESDQYGGRGRTTSTTTTTKRTVKTSYDDNNTSVIKGVRPFDQIDLVLQPEGSLSSTKVLTTTIGMDQGHAPYFVLALRDYSTKEGEPVLFEVVVSAQPSAEILWDKDGEVIGDDSSFRVDYYGDGRATLYIPEAFLDDAGYYTCIARNNFGSARSTARLHIETPGEHSLSRNSQNGISFQYQNSAPSYHTMSTSQYRTYSQQSLPTTVIRVDEETSTMKIIPNESNTSSRYEQNQIIHNITGEKPQFQPVTFQLNLDNQQQQEQRFHGQTSTISHYEQNQSKGPQKIGTVGINRQLQRIEPNQENVAPPENEFMGPDPFKKFGSRRQQRPTTGIIPQQSFETQQNLYATIATQPGPSYYDQQQTTTTTTHLSQKPSVPVQQSRESIRASSSQHQQPEYETTSFVEHSTSPSYKPSFAKQLEPVTAVEGDIIQLTVYLNGQPRPDIQWYHHATPINPNDGHYRIIDGANTSVLEINNVNVHDSGQIWCVATNPSGSATTTCSIHVQENNVRTYQEIKPSTSTVAQQPFSPSLPTVHATHAQIPLHSQQPQSVIPKAPPLLPNFNTIRPQQQSNAPKITNGLKDQALYDGAETTLECQFTGGQQTTAQWFRNDMEITNEQQNRMYSYIDEQSGTCKLVIKMTLLEDQGTYTVRITNSHGQDSTSARLIPASKFLAMQKKKDDDSKRKALVEELAEKQKLRPQKFRSVGGSLPSYGTSDDEVFEPTQRISQHREPTAPTVGRPLTSIQVKEGDVIQLNCQINGFPKPELMWFKNNVPLPLSQRHKVSYDAASGNATVRITTSRPEDSGTYTVLAKNPHGYTQASARIDVIESPSIDNTSYVAPDAFKYIEAKPRLSISKAPKNENDTNSQKPAKIIRTPTSSITPEGGIAQFTCQVDGFPKPKIAWLKNNKPLMAGPRFSTYFEQASRTAVLRITDVANDDAGYYTCVADNPFGSDKSTATLQVRPASKVDQTSYVEPDAFRYLQQQKPKENQFGPGIESQPFVNPDAFRYLEKKAQLTKQKEQDDNLTIDDRPIVDLDAFKYLEAKHAKPKKEDDNQPLIDETPIVPPDAFRYLEAKRAKPKKEDDDRPLIDETPIVAPDAFKYLERKPMRKKPDEDERTVDDSFIVNPDAFKYLERKPEKKVPEDTGALVDETPLINLDAFKYLERQPIPKKQDNTPNIDETPMVNPDVFRYLERPTELPKKDDGVTIDTRPMVNPDVFRYLERPTEMPRRDDGPSIDTRPIVPQAAFRYLDRPTPVQKIPEGPNIDESYYVNPNAFRYLEAKPQPKVIDNSPSIDTVSYVNPNLFASFEAPKSLSVAHDEPEIVQAPRLLQPLRNSQTSEGKSVAMVAMVDGYPAPTITWLKNGVPIMASNRVITNYDISSKAAWIRFEAARPDDAAVYTLIAHNPAGEVKTMANLYVGSVPQIDETCFVPAEAFAKIEAKSKQPPTQQSLNEIGVDSTAFVNPDAFQSFETKPLRDMTNIDDSTDRIQIAPRIIVPLQNIQTSENTNVTLAAKIEGVPVPTFTWLKNNAPLVESNRFVTNYDFPSKTVTLRITDVRADDSGVYTILASSGPYLEHSSAHVQIIQQPNVDQTSFVPLNAFQSFEQQPSSRNQIQPGVDDTSFVLPDRFTVFDQYQPNKNREPITAGVDESPLVNLDKFRLLEVRPTSALPYDVTENLDAPQVLIPLQPLNVQEGDQVVLSAKINGTPMPNFTWYKNMQPLMASNRFTTHYDIPSKLILFQITDARPSDNGTYTVRADNPAGSVETSAELFINSLPSIRDQAFVSPDKFRYLEQSTMRPYDTQSGVDTSALVDLDKIRQLELKPTFAPNEDIQEELVQPRFISELQHIQTNEGQPAMFLAKVEGKPQPRFTWFKNDVPLTEANRFRTYFDIPSKTICLTIADTRPDDIGVYKLVADNPAGSDQTSAELNVNIAPLIDQRSFVPQTAFQNLERSINAPLMPLDAGVDQTSFFNQELFRNFDMPVRQDTSTEIVLPVTAPKVTVPLKPVIIPEGETVVFMAQVEGYPLPTFTWYCNTQPIMASNRVTSHYDMLTKRCFLQILDTRTSDQGLYTLIAENPAGVDRTKTELKVVPVSSIDQTPYVPYDKFSTLEFKPKRPSDLQSGVDATPFVSSEIFRLLETKPILAEMDTTEEMRPLEVVIPLRPAVAQEGQQVILTTKIIGKPVPKFTWLRNNYPLMESNRFKTQYDIPTQTLVLDISDIRPNDSGTYTVIAENPFGRVQTTAPVVVRGDTSIDNTAFVPAEAFRTLETTPELRSVIIPGVDESSFVHPDVFKKLELRPIQQTQQEDQQPAMAPRVITPLQPVKCNEGQTILLMSRIEGSPQPMFFWFKEGQPLVESTRFWTHYDIPSKTVFLQINGARPDDSGDYVCVARNPSGYDQTNAAVTVFFGPAIDTNAFVAPEKFAAFETPYLQRPYVQSGVDETPLIGNIDKIRLLEIKPLGPYEQGEIENFEAPKVVVPLRDTSINEGDVCVLSAKITGRPRPNFVFLKNGQPLVEGSRFVPHYDLINETIILQVSGARPDDSATFSVVAENPAGSVETSARLDVKPQPMIDQKSFVPLERFDQFERPVQSSQIVSAGVDQTPYVDLNRLSHLEIHPASSAMIVPDEEMVAPKVIIPLKPVNNVEGQPCVFTATIEGRPQPKFSWFKNDRPLTEANRFRTHFDIASSTIVLQIADTRPDDSGVYKVFAENPAGSDETSASLNISAVPHIDERSYVPTDKFKQFDTPILRPVFTTSGIDTTAYVSPDKLRHLEIQPNIQEEELNEEMEAPRVIIPLNNVVLHENEPALFSTRITGIPRPKFSLYKNGQPLMHSNRYKTHYDIPTQTLYFNIAHVLPHDVGNYTVVAENPAGRDQTSSTCEVSVGHWLDDRPFVAPEKFRMFDQPQQASLKPIYSGVDSTAFIQPDKFYQLEIKAPPPTQEEIEDMQPPKVIVPLQNVQLNEGEPVLLSTTITGKPRPKFSWFKDNKPLMHSNRYQSHYDIPTQTLYFTITSSLPHDMGSYTVLAENPAGRDQTSCTCDVSVGHWLDDRPFVAPEKFQAFQQPYQPLSEAVVSGVDSTPFIQPDKFSQLELKALPPTQDEIENMQPPKVVVPLQSIQLNEGEPALLQATITGKPQPNFVWFKNGLPMNASNRLRTRYDLKTKQVILQIADVREGDIGEYVVVAKNPAGEDESVCTLSVVPAMNVDQRYRIPPEKFQNLENYGPRRLEIIPGVDNQPFVSPDRFRNLELKPISSGEGEPTEERRPPKVIVPLNDCDLEEFMPVLLSAVIDAGSPMATFTWLKNNQPLIESNRFQTNFDIVTRTITLHILGSRPDDQGRYTIRAVNPVGSDETSATLTIRKTSSIDTRPFINEDKFRPFDMKPIRGDALYEPDESGRMRPPKVLEPMNNVHLTEYQPVLLTSVIEPGYPMARFTWLKDGRVLMESNRYQTNFDINTKKVQLYINGLRPQDQGHYTVKAENICGRDETTGEVGVEGTPAVDDRPFIEPSKFMKLDPRIRPSGPLDDLPNRENLSPWIKLLRELEDQYLIESQAAQLVCVVDAHPKATINWFKDGYPLIVSQRFMNDYDHKSGVVRLTIYPAYASDAGLYQMVACNIAGEVTTRATLRIQSTPNVDESPFVKFAGLRKTPQTAEPVHPLTNEFDGGLQDIYQKPYFKRIPPDQEVPQGQMVRFDCVPMGRPHPELTWYRNGVPIKPDDNNYREVVNEGGLHSLLVMNPELGTNDQYTCVARNKVGEASFTVNLKVVERGANIAPFFIERLVNLIIIEGQDAQLDACAQGNPQPQVVWEKDGQILTPNKEYRVEFEGAKTTLYIRSAKMTDAGWYQCTATSIAGTCLTKGKVIVLPLSEADMYPNDAQFGPQLLNRIPASSDADSRLKYMIIPIKPAEVKPEELYKLPKRSKKVQDTSEDPTKRPVGVLPEEIVASTMGGLEDIPEDEMYSKDRPQPPKFKVHIKSMLKLEEGDRSIFEAKLVPINDPMMRVQWFKNGKPLHHGHRFVPRYDFADVSLEILWTYAEDDGVYECVATNPYGEDRTRTELKCKPKRSIIYNTQLPEGMEGVQKLQQLEEEIKFTASMIGLEERVEEKEPKAPEFIMQLEDVEVDEGDPAKFMVKVDGHPRPRVTWSINNADIANGSRYKLAFDGLVHYLDIPKTRQYDDGVIRCVAKNSRGQVECVAILKLKFRQDYRAVLRKSGQTEQQQLDDSFDIDIEERLRLRSLHRKQEAVDERGKLDHKQPLRSKSSDRMSWRQTVEKVGDPPLFTKPLLPLKAKEGSRVVVSVEFTGTPVPTVSWHRDGFGVEDSEDFKIHTTATNSTLTIKHAYTIDSGLYTVKLFNPIGIKQCQAAIRIVPIIAEDQTPRFLDIPLDCEVMSGDPVRFQCRVDGTPFPTVAFYREDEPVDLTDKRFKVIQEGDVFTLLLFEALPADSGQYEAVADNSAGKANTRFTLIVRPKSLGGKKASIIDDPKLIHKVPYLQQSLTDQRVKEGQSAVFECIIPTSFATDIRWYKDNSEWPIKPSKFFRIETDGVKHQLFILEAYAEDEGLYKCVASNPVGTTATTAQLKVDHVMQVPEFIQSFSNLVVYEGERVRFQVQVRGDPPPLLNWFRDGELIRDSPDFQIFTEDDHSLLNIEEVFMEDGGLFTCLAANPAGSSECSGRLTVEPRPQT